jgi:hypothetical protein
MRNLGHPWTARGRLVFIRVHSWFKRPVTPFHLVSFNYFVFSSGLFVIALTEL